MRCLDRMVPNKADYELSTQNDFYVIRTKTPLTPEQKQTIESDAKIQAKLDSSKTFLKLDVPPFARRRSRSPTDKAAASKPKRFTLRTLGLAFISLGPRRKGKGANQPAGTEDA